MGSVASISRPSDFRKAFAEGERSGGRGLTIYVRRSGSPDTRLGLVVRAPRAVVRNRVKRRLRAAFRAAGPVGGVDVVMRADDSSAGRDFQEMVATIQEALVKGGRA